MNAEQKEALRAFAQAMGEEVPEESGLKGFLISGKRKNKVRQNRRMFESAFLQTGVDRRGRRFFRKYEHF